MKTWLQAAGWGTTGWTDRNLRNCGCNLITYDTFLYFWSNLSPTSGLLQQFSDLITVWHLQAHGREEIFLDQKKKNLNMFHSHSFNSPSTYHTSKCCHRPPFSKNVHMSPIGAIVVEILIDREHTVLLSLTAIQTAGGPCWFLNIQVLSSDIIYPHSQLLLLSLLMYKSLGFSFRQIKFYSTKCKLFPNMSGLVCWWWPDNNSP